MDTKYKQAYPASTETDFKYLKKKMHNFWTRMNSASSGGEMTLFLSSQTWANRGNNGGKNDGNNGGNNGSNGGGWNNPHRNKDCRYCKKRGHIEVNCRKKKADMKKQNNDDTILARMERLEAQLQDVLSNNEELTRRLRDKKENEYANTNVDREFCPSTFDVDDNFFHESGNNINGCKDNNQYQREEVCLFTSTSEVDDDFFDTFGGNVHGRESDDEDRYNKEKNNDPNNINAFIPMEDMLNGDCAECTDSEQGSENDGDDDNTLQSEITNNNINIGRVHVTVHK